MELILAFEIIFVEVIFMHAWHDVFIGENAPKLVNAVVEIPMGSRNKYELDKETGFIKLDRTIYSSVLYPGDYGFIPQTLWEDGDPLDVLVLTRYPTYPLVIIKVRPIGVIKMVDESESDDKILAVPNDDPYFKDIFEMNELPSHISREIKQFFEVYKDLQNKVVKVSRFLDKKTAYKIIEKGILLYNKRLKKIKKTRK